MARDRWPNAGRRITITPTGFLKSPSFRVTYPRIINEDLIKPPSIKVLMDQSWKRGEFQERPVEVFHIRGAYVIGECLIFDRELQVIENASNVYTDEEVRRAVKDVQAADEASELLQHGRLTVLAKQRAVHNYGHFLMYCLPMAYLATTIVGEENPNYLSYLVPAPSQDVVLRSYRLLGIDLDRVLIQAGRQPLYFADLLVIRGLYDHGTYMSPLCVIAVNKMAERIVDAFALMPGRGYDKIFVRRRPGWKRRRELHNEEEVYQRLYKYGFVSVEPGSMSLDHQITIFSKARHVVGVVGAAMTNIAFCQPGTKVTLLFPAAFPDTFFWFIAQHKRLDYVEIRGDQTTYEPPDSWAAGFTLRETDIQNLEVRSVTPV
jgi:capsular polysaccharide biosynthesis protein